jgi:hypothetical protein
VGRAPNHKTQRVHSKLRTVAPRESSRERRFKPCSEYQKGAFICAEMGSFGLEILVNHQGDAAGMQSNVLENLLGLLDTKCMDRYALPHSFESTDPAQDSRKRKLSSCAEGESESECKHQSKRVRFADNSRIRLVSEHSNSNDYRMSQGDLVIEDNESSFSASLLPSDTDSSDAISFLDEQNAGEDESSEEDQDESDDDSLNEFAGFAESGDESEASEASAESDSAMRRDAMDKDAQSSSSDCEQDWVHSAYGTNDDELSFEDAEVRTKEEDGPSIATTVAQARAHTRSRHPHTNVSRAYQRRTRRAVQSRAPSTDWTSALQPCADHVRLRDNHANRPEKSLHVELILSGGCGEAQAVILELVERLQMSRAEVWPRPTS